MAHRWTIEDEEMYLAFMWQYQSCWLCGWTEERRDRWSWMISRLVNAHIVGGQGRRHDRRCLCRLCDACHLLSHGATIKHPRVGRLPNVTRANLLWLKREQDVEHFDEVFLNTLSIGQLEAPEDVAALRNILRTV